MNTKEKIQALNDYFKASLMEVPPSAGDARILVALAELKAEETVSNSVIARGDRSVAIGGNFSGVIDTGRKP